MYPTRFDKALLCRRQSHLTPPPTIDVGLIMQSEIFTKLPSSPLLLPPRRRIMRQIGIGIIIKKARHDSILLKVSVLFICRIRSLEMVDGGGGAVVVVVEVVEVFDVRERVCVPRCGPVAVVAASLFPTSNK